MSYDRLSNVLAYNYSYYPHIIFFLFCKASSDISSFILDFRNLSPLFSLFVNIAKVLSILLIFSKEQLFSFVAFSLLFFCFPFWVTVSVVIVAKTQACGKLFKMSEALVYCQLLKV